MANVETTASHWLSVEGDTPPQEDTKHTIGKEITVPKTHITVQRITGSSKGETGGHPSR